MKNRYIPLYFCLLTTILLFSGCSGGNSILGGSISFINDSNPFVGTWISNTSSDSSGQIWQYDQFEFSNEGFTKYYFNCPNFATPNQYSYTISDSGTWYFLTDGNHIYIKFTSHNPTNPNESSFTDEQRADIAAKKNAKFPSSLPTEIHYTYAMNDAKTQFTITNVANPSDTSTWTRR